MRRPRKKLAYLLICILIISLLAACERSHKVPKDKDAVNKKTPDPEVKEINVMEEYDKLLEIENNRGDIALFLNQYIGDQTKKDASQMIIELEEYLDRNNYNIYESYILLNRYKKYVSLEIRSYLNILFTEGTRTYTDEDKLNISLEEALERAKTAEDHLIIFPNGTTRPKVLELYKKYLSILIVEEDGENILTNKDTTILKEDVINLYRDEINEVETKGISNIFNDYLRLLEKNGLDTRSKEAISFQENLDTIIEEQFQTIEEGA